MTQPASLDQQFCFSLYSTSLAMTQLYKPLLEPLGLTYPQYLVMLILWENDGIGLKEIADRLGQKSGALTPVIKRMEVDGWLQRNRNQQDERSLQIALTAQGRALQDQATPIGKCIYEYSKFSLPELTQLKAQLDQLRHNLDAAYRPE